VAVVKQRDPIVPGTSQDRTGTQGILRRALAQLRRRAAACVREVQAAFDLIPVVGDVARNDTIGSRFTLYAAQPEIIERVFNTITAALQRYYVGDTGGWRGHWFADFTEDAARLGSAQAHANLSALSPSYSASRTMADILFGAPFRNRVAAAHIKSYEHWTGMVGQDRAKLADVVSRAIADGSSVRGAKTLIADAMNVSLRKAEGYAQTDITDALRVARIAERSWAEENLGVRSALLWKSALIPTTRPTHAARNGRVYTDAEVAEFYSRDGNIYRCHCSVTEVLLDENGAPLLSARAKETSRRELAVWRRQYGGK
jgi:hypothetical protein